MDFVGALVILFGVVFLIDKLYKKINLDTYSPIWEYYFKALLYGVILVFTLLYGKDSLKDVSPLEWAIIAVSAIEGGGNYINYAKEAKKRKAEKETAKNVK